MILESSDKFSRKKVGVMLTPGGDEPNDSWYYNKIFMIGLKFISVNIYIYTCIYINIYI